MKISIITVTFNSQDFLENCISSVETQTYPNIEHIVIDGNSTDNTLNILKNKSNIKWISENDYGIYDAMNKGIEMATGDVIGILNSDDFFADEHVISRVVDAFVKNKGIQAVYADVCFVKRDGTAKKLRYYSSKYFKPFMFRMGMQPAHPTFYVKKELFEKYGLYRTDLKIAGDFELLLRFLLKSQVKYKYVNDLWVKMRVGGISTSGVKSVIKLNSEILKSLRENKVYSNVLIIYSKYFYKWWGFVFKR